MINGNDIDRAVAALFSIPPTIEHDTRARVGMAAKDAGVTFDVYNKWQENNPRYNAAEVRSMWKSYKVGPVKVGTLFSIAREHGFEPNGKPQQRPIQAPQKAAEPPRKLAPGMSAAEVWERCEPATHRHPYIVKKGASGVPLDSLRVLPAGDGLTSKGERLAGSLVVPVMQPDGTLSSLQLIAPPDVAERLKDKGETDKPNLSGHTLGNGRFIVGELVSGGVAYICEGIGTAWACWQASYATPNAAAVVCFGSGRVRAVAAELRQQDVTARIVLVPDVGKESDAQKIALEVGALVATMPEGEQKNFDANDLAQRDGLDVLAAILEAAKEPPKPESRYKLLKSDDLRVLPPLKWRVRGVLPAAGLAGLYGPSASGKSFLALDMAAAIAEGSRWFDCRVEAAPVVYAALEGEAGFKLRVAAWEAHQGRPLPAGFYMVLQPFKLTEPQDVADLAAVIPAGAVLFIDTLNRAAPTADENSSKDMGEILSAAKQLQNTVGGLVVMVHHTGKDTSKGLRGHSSLLAALDAAVEVARDGDCRDWRVAKSKDGQDGIAQNFRLKVEMLGLDEYGDPMTSCVVVQDQTERDIKRVKVPQGGNQGLVYNAIRDMFKDGEVGKPGAPPLRPCIRLEAAVIRGASALTCETHRRATRTRAAITALVSRGVLGLNDGWLWTP